MLDPHDLLDELDHPFLLVRWYVPPARGAGALQFGDHRRVRLLGQPPTATPLSMPKISKSSMIEAASKGSMNTPVVVRRHDAVALEHHQRLADRPPADPEGPKSPCRSVAGPQPALEQLLEHVVDDGGAGLGPFDPRGRHGASSSRGARNLSRMLEAVATTVVRTRVLTRRP